MEVLCVTAPALPGMAFGPARAFPWPERIICPTQPPMDALRTLLASYLFQDLTPAELESLAERTRHRDLAAGEYAFHTETRQPNSSLLSPAS